MTTITALPTAPSRADPTTFSARSDALLGALDQFVTETNTVAGEVNANATIATTQAGLATTNGAAQVALAAAQVALATTQATNAANSATASAQSALVAGAVAWVSGTTYAIGDTRYSPANGQTYRRLTAGAGTTDPSADTTNWVIVNGITSEAILLTTNNLPTVRPTLNLDFANSKIVDPRITFTRASTATRTNEKGLLETVASGTPRIDYDPVTLACKGLLVEESRTNLLTYSEQFDNAAWTKSAATVSTNAATAPDGTATADKLAENTANSAHYVQQGPITTVGSTTYTASVFAKAGARTKLEFLAFIGSVPYDRGFDLSNGTSFVSTLGGVAATNYSITAVGNGWYRCTITQTADATTSSYVRCALSNGTVSTYTGDGTSGIYIWGAQLEAGAFATSYIPTTSSQVTRAADAASMTGTNFSSWYRQDEGTFVVDFDVPATTTDSTARIQVGVSDGTFSQSMYTQRNSSPANVVTHIVNGSVSQASMSSGTASVGVNQKNAFAYKTNDFAALLNGGSAVTDTSGTMPSGITQMYIGGAPWGGDAHIVNSHISRIAYYPIRLANATLQALSTL